jgi:hypothetical protein
MVEVVEFPYNQALNVWMVLVDGIVYQCFETETAAQAVVDGLRGATWLQQAYQGTWPLNRAR